MRTDVTDNYQDTQLIQSPLIPANDVGNIEPSIRSPFGLAAASSTLGPMIFGLFGGLGSEALKSLKVKVGVGLDAIAPAALGGILLSPVLYCLLIYQKENCTRLREPIIERSVFLSYMTNPRDKLSASFVLLIGYSLVLGHSITAATIGHVVIENLPYSKYHDDLSQLILTMALGSGIYISYGAILLACATQCFSPEMPEEIENVNEYRSMNL